MKQRIPSYAVISPRKVKRYESIFIVIIIIAVVVAVTVRGSKMVSFTFP